MVEALRSSKTSNITRATRRNTPEDGMTAFYILLLCRPNKTGTICNVSAIKDSQPFSKDGGRENKRFGERKKLSQAAQSLLVARMRLTCQKTANPTDL
jgi:hypothetical protein